MFWTDPGLVVDFISYMREKLQDKTPADVLVVYQMHISGQTHRDLSPKTKHEKTRMLLSSW